MAAGRFFPNQVKEIAPIALSELIERRRNDQLGTEGRPQWVADNLASIDFALLVPYTWNMSVMLRCNVVVFLSDQSVGRFPIDLRQDEYRRLPSASPGGASNYLGRVLLRFPMLPVDEAELAAGDVVEEDVQAADD